MLKAADNVNSWLMTANLLKKILQIGEDVLDQILEITRMPFGGNILVEIFPWHTNVMYMIGNLGLDSGGGGGEGGGQR